MKERLTEKDTTKGGNAIYYANKNTLDRFKTIDQEIRNKLGQLEDVEDETGISLQIFFKALKNGIWYKDRGGQISHEHITLADAYISPSNKLDGLYFRGKIYDYHFECYGEYWALTREELEDEEEG